MIDWLQILQARGRRAAARPAPGRSEADAAQPRLTFQGTTLSFSTERDDYWWWLMANGDVNAARLMLAVLDDPAWKDDMGRLANGFIGAPAATAPGTPPRPTCGAAWRWRSSRPSSRRCRSPAARRRRPLAQRRRRQRRLEQGRAHQDQRRRRRAAPDERFGAPAAPGQPAQQHDVPALGQTRQRDTLNVTHQGTGKPWLTLQSLAAIAAEGAFHAPVTRSNARDAGRAGRARASSRAATCCA